MIRLLFGDYKMNLLDRGENFVRLMEECHRIVIVLTLNFIKDDWSVFSLQKVMSRL